MVESRSKGAGRGSADGRRDERPNDEELERLRQEYEAARRRYEEAMVTAAPPVPAKGTAIRIQEAAQRYGVTKMTLNRWINRGWVRVLEHGGNGPGSFTLVDEHDVAAIIQATPNMRQGRRTDRGMSSQ